MRLKKNTLGFSLLESMIALAIGLFFLGGVIGTWYFSSKSWKEEQVKNELRIDIEKAMERIKAEVRISDANKVLFYPSTGSSYTAMSLPLATADSSGLYDRTNGTIDWDTAVVYHVYANANTGRSELRRTTFTYNATTTTRQTQLDNCVTGGTYTGGTTTVLFSADTATLEIVPQSATFDGYSASEARSGSTNFGSLEISAGNHQIRFEVTGQNALSSGHGIGIDSLTLSPSGGAQEAEALMPVYASSGATPTTESMDSEWGGVQQVDFASTALGHYMTFETYYDQWLESNFTSVTDSDTMTTGTDPYLTIASRQVQSLAPSWQASDQTAGGDSSDDATASGMSIRTVIESGYITSGATMIRFKFEAANGSPLTVSKAYFGPRSGTCNYSSTPITLYFDNGYLPAGSTDPEGSTSYPGTNTGITIPAGNYAWTNWFPYSPGGTDYLVSMYVSGSATTVTPNPVGSDYSYRVNNDQADSTSDWTTLPGYIPNQGVYAVTQMAAWRASGTATSQVYDTHMTSPAYSQFSWTPTLPTGCSITMKIRSSSDPQMTGATDWSLLSGYTSSPVSLGTLANLRYVQFQAVFQAASPYTSSPQLDNVKITWPGQTALVEFSGYYTTRPNYGTFRVLVDGTPLVKTLEVKLSASDAYKGRDFSFSLNTEQNSMNTGK